MEASHYHCIPLDSPYSKRRLLFHCGQLLPLCMLTLLTAKETVVALCPAVAPNTVYCLSSQQKETVYCHMDGRQSLFYSELHEVVYDIYELKSS